MIHLFFNSNTRLVDSRLARITKKGGKIMILMVITTLGFVISLGIVGILLHYFTNKALNQEDAKSIDPIPNDEVTESGD